MNIRAKSRTRNAVVIASALFLISLTNVVAVTNLTNNPTRNQNEPMMAINPLDHSQLVCGYNNYYSGWKAGWSWSDNGGDTWTYGGNHAIAGYLRSGDPVIAFNSSGECYYTGLAYNGGGSSASDGSIFFATSPDGGHSFDTPIVIAAGTGTTNYLDKPWMYVNPYNDDIYIAYVQRVNLRDPVTEEMSIWFCHSTDGGGTFSTPFKISNFSPETGTNRSHGPQITATSPDNVIVAWHTLESGDPVTVPFRIFAAQSTDGGDSFGSNYEAVEAEFGKPTIFISMDTDQNTGRIYIAYCDSPVSSPRNYNVYVISSTTAAGPWSAPVTVNDYLPNWQFWPALDVSPDGRVDVVWYDQRSLSSETEVFYSASTDGGVTWSANTRVSSPSDGFSWPFDFAGDYITIVSTNEKAVMAWMDSRDRGTGYPRQDIYAAIEWIEFPVPILLSPTGGVTTEANLPTFTWSSYGDSHTIEIATDPAFNNLIVSASYIYQTEYTPSVPLDFSDYTFQPGGGGSHDPLYYWRVKARYESSDESDFSATGTFIVTGPAEVPSEYRTISAARSSFPLFIGGTVLVAPGTYTGLGNCDIGMGGEKPVDVIATGGPEVTIIDCQSTYPGFHYGPWTVGSPEVNGFTIRNAGSSGYISGAFVCYSGGAGTMRNCIIENNAAPGVKAWRGGYANVYNTIIRGGDQGVVVTSSGSLNMVGCEIYNQWGWGIEAHDRDGGDANAVVVDSCLFYGNTQGDILIWGANNFDISNSTILPASTGIWFYGGSDVSTVSNTIVAFSPSRGVQWTNPSNSVEISCSNIYGNASGDWTDRSTSQLGLRGNIADNPQFCDAAADVYGLLSTSPCAAGNSACGEMGGIGVCQGYTPTGSNVEVDVTDEVSVTFGQVTSAGTTTVELLDPGDTQTPADFTMQPAIEPILYQVSTTATISGTITICFQYDPALVDGPEEDLRLLHSDGSLPLTWNDITILPVDTFNNIICGNAPSLSPFIMGFWCCGQFTSGQTGNTNCDDQGRRNLADITRLIDRVYISKESLCCEKEGDVDGAFGGRINLADITRLIDHVYISKHETAGCK